MVTGKIAFISIPRDTYVTNPYCIGHKINAIYRGKNIEPLIEQVESMLDVNIDYYAVVDQDVIAGIVDTIGGVEIDVPIRMKYDDPTQDLHIDIQPGVQTLSGAKAVQYIRFRKNNDGTGYLMGDIDREKVQQGFIKALISTVLQPANLLKVNELIRVALNGTDTNVTLREATRYITDIPNIDFDNVVSYSSEGTTPYIDGLSYFVMDEEATQNIIKTYFAD